MQLYYMHKINTGYINLCYQLTEPCHLFGTKPLSEPILEYCQLAPWEISIKI